MPRLIDAEKLWKAITTRIEEYCDIADLIEIIETQPTVDIDAITGTHERIGFDKGFNDGYAQATVDAVEVVRCKDCVHSYMGNYFKGYACKRLSGEDTFTVSPDDYCSKGERRE